MEEIPKLIPNSTIQFKDAKYVSITYTKNGEILLIISYGDNPIIMHTKTYHFYDCDTNKTWENKPNAQSS